MNMIIYVLRSLGLLDPLVYGITAVVVIAVLFAVLKRT